MMVGPIRRSIRLVATTLAVAGWLVPSVAWSRVVAVSPYPITSVWPAAVRFLRVDRGFPVREKDESASYVLFDYTDGPKPCRGSIELIRTTDREDREATRIAISIPDMPHRYEQMLLDKFVAKLHEDEGPPAPPPPKPLPPPPPAPPDAGRPNPPPTTSPTP